ncbi:MAG: PEP-CTERM sorting domain-containing protein, partial [Pirellula sp.]
VNSPSQYVYSNIIDLGGPIGGTSNTLFFLRYTIPAGIEGGKTVQSIFLANSDGFTSGGVLENQVNNNFVSIARSHTAVPEPTSLLLVTTTAALLGWKLRRRQKRAS